jgi:hypothetical protein
MAWFLARPADLSHALPRQTLDDDEVGGPRRGYGSGGLGNADRGTGSERLERRAALDSARGCPRVRRVAEYITQSPYDALLRLDKPGPGIAALGAFNCGDQSMVALGFYLYGDQAAGTVAHETPLWEAWFQERFAMPTEPSKSE